MKKIKLVNLFTYTPPKFQEDQDKHTCLTTRYAASGVPTFDIKTFVMEYEETNNGNAYKAERT